LYSPHNERFKKISENIKRIRLEKGITQKQLAEMAGISFSYLSKIEAVNCNKSFSLHVLFDIADVLEEDIVRFFK